MDPNSGQSGGAAQVPNPSAPATPSTSNAPEWTAGFKEEIKGYALKKEFKDPESVVQSYRDLEKLIGVKERLLTLPEKADDKEAWNQIYTKLGRPEKPEEYNLPLNEKAKEYGTEDNDKKFKAFAEAAFHELGLTTKQGRELAEKWGNFAGAEIEAMRAQKIEAAKADEASLAKEWGLAYTQNIEQAKAAAKQFGLEGKEIDGLQASLGYSGTMKLMHRLFEKIGEDSFLSSGGGRFGINSPDQARARISDLMKDTDFQKKLMNKNVEAKDQWNRLHKEAYPE
jgi:hypothetical protein